MDTKEIEKFTREILNETRLRSKLREKVPSIDRLENLDSLRDLSLTRMQTKSPFMVWYEGTASHELYPHLRANLIQSGVINRNNTLDSSIKNKDQQDEYEEVRFGVLGNSIQVIIKAYNPDYKKD